LFFTKRNIEIAKLAYEYLKLASVKSTQQVLIGFLPSTFFLPSRFNMFSGNDLLLFLVFPSMKSCIYPDPFWPYSSKLM